MALAAGVVLGSMLGCGPTISIDDETTGTTEMLSASATASPTTVTTDARTTTTSTGLPPGTTIPPPTDESTTGFMDGGFFLDWFDDAIVDFECDLWAQDCPPGDKCMPWANDGGDSWNATHCTPVAPDPVGLYEECIVEGNGFSGFDDCDYGLMCWDVDPGTNVGTCVALCGGDESEPLCADGTACSITNDGALILCLPVCDPLLQDCAPGYGCYGFYDHFSCALDASGRMGGPGSPCEYGNTCDPGLSCVATDLVPGCMSELGCCSPFCDLIDPMPPCLPGQDCTAWYEPGMAPAGYENAGVCALPA